MEPGKEAATAVQEKAVSDWVAEKAVAVLAQVPALQLGAIDPLRRLPHMQTASGNRQVLPTLRRTTCADSGSRLQPGLPSG